MVKPLESLTLPLGHPLVEILLSLKDKDKGDKKGDKSSKNFSLNFKKEVSTEDQTKFKKAIEVMHAIVNHSASSRYLSDEDQKILENLSAAKTISNELVEQALEFVSNNNVYVDFETFKKMMLAVDSVAVGIESYSQTRLEDLNGGHWDLEVPCTSKESVSFRFDHLEGKFYARSSLHKDDLKTDIVAIDFGTKSTTASYMDKDGRYRLLSIGNTDAESSKKFENPTIVEFREREFFLEDYNALEHRPFTSKNDMEVAYEAQKNFKELMNEEVNSLSSHFHNLGSWQDAKRDNFSEVIDNLRSTFNEFDGAAQEQIAWLKERIRVLEEDY